MPKSSYQHGLLFTRTYNAVRQRIYATLSHYSMTPSHWSVMGASSLSDNGIKVTEVAEEMGVTIPMVTMLVNDLSEQGVLQRVPHETDGRAKLIVLTPKGKKLAAKVEIEINQIIKMLMIDVSPTEAKDFESTLQKILKNAYS